jgi:hypothetical protein
MLSETLDCKMSETECYIDLCFALPPVENCEAVCAERVQACANNGSESAEPAVDSSEEALSIAMALLVGVDVDGDLSQLKNGLLQGIDFAAGFSPAASFARDCYEATTGKRLLTGEPLSDAERFMAFVGVASVGVAGAVGALMSRMETLRDAGKIRNFEKTSDTVRALQRDFDARFTLVRRESAGELNARLVAAKMQPSYAPNAPVVIGRTKAEMRVFRVSPAESSTAGRDTPGQDPAMFGLPVFPGPSTTQSLTNAYAIPTTPRYVSELRVPAGVEVRVSLAGENVWGTGGKIQYELLAPQEVRETWVVETNVLLPAGAPQVK